MTRRNCRTETDVTQTARIWLMAMLFAAAFALAACDQANGTGKDKNGKDAKDEVPAVPVEVAATRRAEMAAVYTGTAPIESERAAFVMPKVKGEIRQVLVDEGQHVREGQILARLDGDQLRLEVALAEATMRKLERDYARNTELQAKGLISAVSIDNLKYELEAARASWELTRLQLSYTDIRSPIGGTVTRRTNVVKVGNTVTPVGGVIESTDSALFFVEDLDTLMLRINVPERELAKLEVGQIAELGFDAVPSRAFTGKVALISPYVDDETATFMVRIRITDTSGLLRPGMFARVAVIYERKLDALQIPRTALLDGDGPPKVFVVKDGKAAERPVQLGLSNGAYVEIVTGLKDGEQVVVVGQAAIKPGATVRIVNTPARPSARTQPAVAAG
ncbi:MAG: efflux RND transporter periplasmic adaptor subunit [Gammaproteobacteria bacterium]|nr:efflux RND transporter periplasmic adaptor subunit [Gammaproteobacteria bacterium]